MNINDLLFYFGEENQVAKEAINKGQKNISD